MSWVVKWRDAYGTYRAHDARFEGRKYATREEAEAVAAKFRTNDRTRTYWVQEVEP